MADPDDHQSGSIKVRVLNLAGREVAELLVSGRTSVKEIKRKLEQRKLCAACEEIFQREPMLLETSGPLTVVGNIHGHFEQLLKLFEHFGTPDKRRYLFLGGYVNKGSRSLDTICLLFLYKAISSGDDEAQQPENLLLLRSNHEDAQMSRIYGFFDECVNLWKYFCRTFNMMMPVCALVNEKIFCVHGGISPELQNLDQIRELERPCAVPDAGLLCDLLWADPSECTGWGDNDRGVSVTFGADDVAKDFVTKFKLELICRSHEVVEDGVAYFADRTVVTTLWSVLRFKGMDTPHIAAVMVVMEDGQRTFEFVRD